MEESRTTIYQKDSTITYQLKMKASRAVFSEVQKKAGAFPFNIRVLEDEKRARLGLQEAVQHGLVKPYEVVWVYISALVRLYCILTILITATRRQIHLLPGFTSPSPCSPLVPSYLLTHHRGTSLSSSRPRRSSRTRNSRNS